MVLDLESFVSVTIAQNTGRSRAILACHREFSLAVLVMINGPTRPVVATAGTCTRVLYRSKIVSFLELS